MARRPDPERSTELQRVRERAPAGHVLRIPAQRVFVLLEDTGLRSALELRFEERGVTTVRCESASEVIHFASDSPPSAVLTYDEGPGTPGAQVYDRLRAHFDERLHEVPVIVVHRGRTHELTRYESRVRLVRAPVDALALASIVCTVLAQRPHVVVRPPSVGGGPARASHRRGAPHVPARDLPDPEASVLRALKGELTGAVQRIAAQIERVGDLLEVRCVEPFGAEREGELVVQVRWNSPRAERFLVEAEGGLPAGDHDRLTLLPQRGIRGRLSALLGLERTIGDGPLDDAYLMHGDAAGLELPARARSALLVLAQHALTIEQHADRLCVSLAQVPRHELARQVEASVELWRAAHRLRREVT